MHAVGESRIKPMPELPTVEVARRTMYERLKNETFRNIECFEDSKVLECSDLSSLLYRKIIGSGRLGKLFWLTFEPQSHLIMHFGMTGKIVWKDEEPMVYESSKKIKLDADVWPPKYCKFAVDSENFSFAFIDPRRLAKVHLHEGDISEHPKIKALGFDATRMDENFELFCSQTTGKTLSIKSFLLDQRFICGIGNWIADEVLYQSKVCPTRRTCDLKSTELKSLSDAIKDVIQVAISCNAVSDKFPSHWIFHHRWSKGKKNVLLDGNIVKFISINGRTTAYVPSIQF